MFSRVSTYVLPEKYINADVGQSSYFDLWSPVSFFPCYDTFLHMWHKFCYTSVRK